MCSCKQWMIVSLERHKLRGHERLLTRPGPKFLRPTKVVTQGTSALPGFGSTALSSSIQSNHSSDSPTKNVQFSASTMNRIKTSLNTVLMLLEEECEEGSSISHQITHKPHNLVIPNHDQQTLAELECVHCEFLDHHLLTMHRLKSYQSTENLRGPLPGDIACVWKVDNHSGQGSLEHALKCPGVLPISGHEVSDIYGYREGIVSVLSKSSSKFNVVEVCRVSDRFFIGSEDGNIKQRCRAVSQRVCPENFKLSFAVAAVTCLALHPFLPSVLIAGYSDGQLALFLTHHPHPIFKWLIKVQSDWPSIGVRKVIWSPHRPNVTFCLATDGDIIAWTLLDEEQAILRPRAQTLIIGTIRERRIVDFSVARGRSGCLAVCWQDGAEIHWLEENLVAKQEDELLSLENALSQLL
ncbi:unnamed protein product [Taenia asiatica]|uniref:WD_REPEATS_REGION domain-containing protein n=1 Tax=Taenia asiatica TaxID=60517 RepID=A0A0R3WF11_TAEAS|nr:unnamed protein product [Taenia asiatica]